MIELDVAHNPNITNVSFMTNLKKLDASGKKCGIDQEGINGLDLDDIYSYNNPKIKKN